MGQFNAALVRGALIRAALVHRRRAGLPLAVIEISPSMTLSEQRAALLGLLISGGMLITGNVPNVVAASGLRLSSREWAQIGVGVGVVLLILCFPVLLVLSR